MNSIRHKVLFLILSTGWYLGLYGQQYPTSSTVILNTPHPVYISDYYAIGSNAFQSILNLNDLNEVTWDVRLKVKIEGQGIVITTKPDFIPPVPLTLTAGVPTTFQGTDFAQYLDVNNVDLQGITASSFSQSGKLPEGLYEFCVEILDYNTGTPLSLPSCATAFIFFEPPPVTLSPDCEDIITPSDPQNIYFTWQIAGGASPTIAMNSKYKLSLYEITDPNDDPYFAVENNHAVLVYESDFLNQTSLSIDFGITTTSLLIPGKKYAYRVRAVDENEKNIYRNDGYSEWCWFFYGFPSDGVLDITFPQTRYVFGKNENKIFSWNTSSLGVPGQQYDYVVNLYKINSGQDSAMAVDQNPVWYNQTLPTTSSMNGGSFILNQDLDVGEQYAWQVTAFTGQQQVAQSPISTFYAPSLLEEFKAGNNVVKVVSLQGTDLSDVSGIGKIQISDDPNDLVEFNFEHLNIRDLNGEMVLNSGTAEIDLSSRPDLELIPNFQDNGAAFVSPVKAVISSGGVNIEGIVKWQFPHATTDGQVNFIESVNTNFVLNSSYKLNGVASVDGDLEFEMLEPNEFKFNILTSSEIEVSNGNYTLKLNGNLAANANVLTNDGNNYKIGFSNAGNLYYMEANSLLSSATNYIQPVPNLNFGFMPKSAIVDLSESTSPDLLSGNPSWKGVYFPEFQLRMYANNTDGTNQLSIAQDIDRHEDLSNAEFWLTNQGVHLEYEFDITEDGTTFNGFVTDIHGELEISDNQISNSLMTGSIKLPVIHRTDEFDFEIPITNDGLSAGYLNEDLTLRDLSFNAFGGENRIDITINRAVFADNERMDLELDMDLTGIDASIQGVSDFRIYGNNTIGFGKPNGSKQLDNQVTGLYKGFAAVVKAIGAASYGGNYVFSYEADLDMGPGAVGENGPPVLAISSAESIGSDVELPVYGTTNPQPEPEISIPADIDPNESTLTTQEMYISIDNEMVGIDGYLKLTNNDPNWGTSFRGGINGQLKIPAAIEVGSNIIFGDRDGTKFWYFDAYFNDTEGIGIAAPPFFNVVAMEGRMYHHMSKQDSMYVVDPDLAFGAGLYLQLIDNQMNGRLFAIDAGAELEIYSDGDFIFAMSGDGAFVNTTARSPNGGLTSAVGEAVVDEVLEAIGPIELSFDVDGGTLAVKAESITSGGSLRYTKGDLDFGIAADISNTPGLAVDFAKGGDSFGFEANAAGTAGFNIDLDGNSLGLGLSGSDGGYFNYAFGDVSLGMDVKLSDKTGSFNVGFGGTELGFGVGSNEATMNFSMSDNLSFESGFSTEGEAYLGLQVDNNSFRLDGNKAEQSGALAFEIDGLEMNLDANLQEKSGNFGFKLGGTELGVGAVANKSGYFNLTEGGNNYGIDLDLESKSGNVLFSYDGGSKEFRANVADGEEGALFFKHNNTEFGIAGNSSGTKGSLTFKNGSDGFAIAADANEKTGSVSFDFGGVSMDSELSQDSGAVNVDVNGMSIGASLKSSGAGRVSFDDGSNAISLAGDPKNQTGAISIKVGSDEYSASTDVKNNEHHLLVNSNGNSFAIDYADNAKLIKYENGSGFEIYGSENNSVYEVGTTISGHSVKANTGGSSSQIAYSGMGIDVVFNTQFVELQYNNDVVNLSANGVLINGQTPSEIINNAQFDITKTVSGLDVGLSANSGTYTLSFAKDGNSVVVTTTSFNDGSVSLTYNGNTYQVGKVGTEYSAGYNDYGVSYDNGTVTLTQGTSNSLMVSSQQLELRYGDYEFDATPNSFRYKDQNNELEVASDRLKVAHGDYGMYVEDGGFGLDIGSTKHLYVTGNSADFKYDNYEASFVENASLNLSDGTRSLALSNSSIALYDGDRGLELMEEASGTPYVKLTNGDDFFEVGASRFAVEYDGKRYAISETENLNIEIDANNHIEIMNNGAKYVNGQNELIIGGDDNFLELKDADKSFAVTQDGAVEFNYGDYFASLNSDYEINFSDGTRDIVIYDENNYFSYNQSDYEFKIRKEQGDRPKGVEATIQGYTGYVEGSSNDHVKMGISGPGIGEASVKVQADKDIEARFLSGSSVYGFLKDGDMLIPITGEEPEPPSPEYLEGSGSAEAMDGPQHLTNSISEEAGGSIKGKAELSYNSATQTFIANAAVDGNSPVCINGAMALHVSPDLFKLDIGTSENRVSVYPTCSGFGGGGWLNIESNSSATTVEVGAFVGWQASGGVSIGSSTVGASLSAEVSAELGAMASATIEPDFAINSCGIWVDLYAGLYAKYWFLGSSGSITIASIGLSGSLIATFEDQTNVAGQLSGHINILDVVKESFNMSFNTTF